MGTTQGDTEMQCRRGDIVCNAFNYLKKLKFCTYCRRKAYAQMSMDIALVATNVAHLTKVLRGKDHDEMRFMKIVLISVSIALEVAIGILLCVKEKYDIDEEKNQRFMNIMNDVVVFVIFTSVLVHVFVSVFVEDHHIPSRVLERYYSNCSALH
ncbi:ninjurin-1 [Nephila pilipes]|uniref:Ninjurin-1 n=1 Tax=Nephila pilipes TaxID=299642 RepID=A0A8X6PFC1_NEPPI|nr:ninjurin-1 [Nephila pilipes]